MADLTVMIDTLGTSINPLMKVISGFCYCFGLLLVWLSIKKLRDMADQRARQTGGGRSFIPLAYGLGGFTLIYLPTMITIAENSFFGIYSPIAYADWFAELKQKYGNSVYVLTRLTQLGGLIWFVRGVHLLVQASEPGVQHGPKGMGFLLAGIFALNVQYTANAVAYVMNEIAKLTV